MESHPENGRVENHIAVSVRNLTRGVVERILIGLVLENQIWVGFSGHYKLLPIRSDRKWR